MKQWLVLAVMAAAMSALVLNADAADDKKGKGGGKGGGAPTLSKMDADGDGVVSLAEFQKARKAEDEETMKKAAMAFKKMDADGNGTVCAVEFKKWQESMPAKKPADKKAAE